MYSIWPEIKVSAFETERVANVNSIMPKVQKEALRIRFAQETDWEKYGSLVTFCLCSTNLRWSSDKLIFSLVHFMLMLHTRKKVIFLWQKPIRTWYVSDPFWWYTVQHFVENRSEFFMLTNDFLTFLNDQPPFYWSMTKTPWKSARENVHTLHYFCKVFRHHQSRTIICDF